MVAATFDMVSSDPFTSSLVPIFAQLTVSHTQQFMVMFFVMQGDAVIPDIEGCDDQPASNMRVKRFANREDTLFLYCRVQKWIGGVDTRGTKRRKSS